jgi:hypothetical protein
MAETEGFEPSIRFRAYDDLANRCLQPLGHVSPNQWASAPIEAGPAQCKTRRENAQA